jgi:hypothetical protein
MYSDGIRTGRPGFGSQQKLDFSLLHRLQAGSEAHPASYPRGTGDSFSGSKEAGGVKLITYLHLIQRSRMMELYLYASIYLHGVVLN